MNLATVLSQIRRKTAIARTDYSRPVRIALTDGLIDPTTTVFDYGCGLGDDVRHLSLQGISSWGWDPEHRQDAILAPARIVNLGYVVNVIEDVEERVECLKRAWSFAQGTLIVSARLATDTADPKPTGAYGDELAEFRERGSVATVEASRALWEHARRIRPEWPTADDSARDFAEHLRLKRLLDRAAHVFARR